MNLKTGKTWIRLPKDWHATKPALKQIAELVNARVPGTWTMNANTGRFLLTFTRESEAETVQAYGESESKPVDVEDDFVVMDKEVTGDGEPW